MSRVFPALAIAFGLLVGPASAADTAAPAASSSLAQGTLHNGLRYAILPHTAPRGGISLRLVVDAGSLDEHDDERGFAHFVEHMAFEGTRHHPPGTLTAMFQRLGLTWGADLNASTNYASTIYKLDLPEDRLDHLPEALQLLRDYADGLDFAPAEVDRERGVVLSELRARDLDASRAANAITRDLYAGTLVADREVIGLSVQIEHATADALRAFYRRCYQPARMTVIVVGNLDPAEFTLKIAHEFESFAADRAAPPAVEPALPPPLDDLKAHIIVNPSLGAASLSFVAVTQRPQDTRAGFREELKEIVATYILQVRLNARRQKNLDRYGATAAVVSLDPTGFYNQHIIEVQTSFSRWADAVELAESELRRARMQGFDAAEVKEAVTAGLKALQNLASSFTSAPSSQFALALSRTVAVRRQWHNPFEQVRIATEELASVTPAEIGAKLEMMFPDYSFHIVLRGPKPVEAGPEAILAAYRKSAAQPLPNAAPPSEALIFRYADFGEPGKIAFQQREPDLGLELARFANGVQLNLRASTLEPQRFLLRATLGRGIADTPKSRPGLVSLANALLAVSDFGRHPNPEVRRLIELHGIAFDLSMADGSAVITASGPTTELPFALQLVTALISDLKLDPKRLPTAVARYSSQIRGITTTPVNRVTTDGLYSLSDRDPRFLVAASTIVSQYPFTEVSDWLQVHWLRGPLEIGIVGDFSPIDVCATASTTVGTLPTRNPRSPVAASERLVFTTITGKQVYRAKLNAGAAAAFLAWPVSLPDDPRSNRALQLAADVLRDRLRVTLREALGATYSPQAVFTRNQRQPDFAYLWATLTFEPKSASALTNRVIALADDLAQHGVTDEELARLKEPRRSRNAEQMRDNTWWLGAVVAFAQSRPGVIVEARGHLTGFDEITRADVDRAARAFAEDAVTAAVVVPLPPDEPHPTPSLESAKK